MNVSRWFLIAVIALFACSPEPPTLSVKLELEPSGLTYDDLERLRLITRSCEDERLALASDLSLASRAGEGSRQSFDAEVIPGEAFYVWIQAWRACPTTQCEPEATAKKGDCICFSDLNPPVQQMVGDACTDWLLLEEGLRNETLTLTSTGASSCPPAKPRDCTTI